LIEVHAQRHRLAVAFGDAEASQDARGAFAEVVVRVEDLRRGFRRAVVVGQALDPVRALAALVESLGGPPTAGIGFALGLDRTLLACDDEGVFAAPDASVDVFVVDTTGGLEALTITNDLRAAGIRADRAYENRSMKSQMKGADRSGAQVAVIVGSNEVEAGTVVVRPLRGEDTQREVARESLVAQVTEVLVQSLREASE